MAKSSFVDFKAVKAAITMEQVLEHYSLLDQFKRSGDSLSGPCPIHRGGNPTQFRVSISKNIWNCFSECKHGGNTLDFISRMENVSIHAAALKAIEWFGLDPEAVSGSSEDTNEPSDETPRSSAAPQPKPASNPVAKPAPAPESGGPNKPLKFRLDKLERNHPYLTERGLTQETIIDFGIGFCAKGIMADRIAIPIHNVQGEIVVYAGRLASEQIGGADKYRLPPGFKKSLELFNSDRAFEKPAETPLIIVEGFFDCMAIYQLGHRRVVALMGCSLSAVQEELIRKNTERTSQVIVMLDEDEAGRTGREEIAVRLSRFVFVRVHGFGKEGMQPEQLSLEELAQILGGAQ